MKLELVGRFRDAFRCYHLSLWKRARQRMATSRLLLMMMVVMSEFYLGSDAYGMEERQESCLRAHRQELGWLATF